MKSSVKKSTPTKSPAKRPRTAKTLEKKMRDNKEEKATPKINNSAKEKKYKINSIFFVIFLNCLSINNCFFFRNRLRNYDANYVWKKGF